MRHLIPLCLLLAAAAAASPVSAQERKITLRTLALGGAELPELWAADSGDAVKLEFSPVQPSEPLRLDRLDPFPIHAGPLNEKGRPTDPSPSMVRLPDSPAILLLGWMAEDKPRFLPIPDPFGTAGRDEWLVINSTDTTVALQIGGDAEPALIKPGSHRMLRVTAPADQGAAVTIASQKDEAWRTFYSTYWPIHADKRCLILLVRDGTKIRVKQIFEDIAPARRPGDE